MTTLPMASPEGDNSRRYVPRQRNPLNAPGPFCTEANSCVACCLPEAEAPDLLGFEDDLDNAQYGCFFKKQPETPEELDRAFSAMRVNCLETLRYSGNDSTMLRCLRKLGMDNQCDYPLPNPL